MTRNLIAHASTGEGGYTFNAFPPDDYEGFVLTVACVRLGDHAHLDIDTGRTVPSPGRAYAYPRATRGHAGRLILRWHEWLMLREVLDSVPWARIAEVENPTLGQIRQHAG